MDDTRQFLPLIGDIYDAALDPASWPSVIGKLAGFVGGSTAALYWKDAATKTGGVHHEDGGMDPAFRQLYFEKFVPLDPSNNAMIFAPVDEPVAGADFMTREELFESRFYREWMRPQGLTDAVNTVLDKTATGAASLIVFRRECDGGEVDEEARSRMRLIAPHVRRAAQIGRMIDRKTDEAAALADAFDGLSAGMFLVDADGAIAHANAAGQELLEAGEVVRDRGGRLATNNPKADLAFRDILRSARDGDAEIGVKGIGMTLGGGGERHVAHVLPLTSGARRRTGAGYAAVAALFVHKATIEARSPPETIARYYALTPTELRVLFAIVDVGGGSAVAEALGIAQETVKWHLARLYQKTGATRQADLVKLVASFSNPLLS